MFGAIVDKNVNVLTNVEQAAEIFAEHGSFIRSTIAFKINNEALCEDLFQDVFLFLVAQPIPEGVQNIKGFLYKAIADRITDAVRNIGSYQARINRYSKRQTISTCAPPEEALIDLEETEKMFKLLQSRLYPKEVLALKLRYLDDYNRTEAAEKMAINPKSVSRYVSVGLKKVRQALGVNKGDNYGSL